MRPGAADWKSLQSVPQDSIRDFKSKGGTRIMSLLAPVTLRSSQKTVTAMVRELRKAGTSGADLTFATLVAARSRANVKSKAPLESIFSSGPIPTFAKVPAAMGCECWNWTTRCLRPIACAFALSAMAVPAHAATITITMENLVVSPAETTAKVGDTLELVNKDFVAHTATARNGDFDVMMPSKKTVTYVLKKAGTVDYFCRFHPNMKATLKIEP